MFPNYLTENKVNLVSIFTNNVKLAFCTDKHFLGVLKNILIFVMYLIFKSIKMLTSFERL